MSETTLAMTAGSHAVLMDYLFPGDGLEAAAVLICNRGTGRIGRRLLVADIICPPYEECRRRPDEVLWPFAETVSPELITEMDRRNQFARHDSLSSRRPGVVFSYRRQERSNAAGIRIWLVR